MSIIIDENQEQVQEYNNYVNFVRLNFQVMKQMLPENVRFIHIAKSLAKSWRKHIDQNISLNDAMIYVKNEFMFQQDMDLVFNEIQDMNLDN